MNALWRIIQNRGGGISLEEAEKMLGREELERQMQKLFERDMITDLYHSPGNKVRTHIGTPRWIAQYIIDNILEPALQKALSSSNIPYA
jgi:hypothetical protein